MDETKKNAENTEEEYAVLRQLAAKEDLVEKKVRIFSRLLMDATLAKEMEMLAERHAQRKTALLSLTGKKQMEGKE